VRHANDSRSAELAARQRRTHSQTVDFDTFPHAAACAKDIPSSTTRRTTISRPRGVIRALWCDIPGLPEVVSFDTHSLSAGPDPLPTQRSERPRARQLDRGCYCNKRERERERDASAMLRHLPTGVFAPAAIPDTYVPNELTRKQLPHRSEFRSLSKRTLYKRCQVDHSGKTQTRSLCSAPLRTPLQETLYSTSSHMLIPNSKSTIHTSPGCPSKRPRVSSQARLSFMPCELIDKVASTTSMDTSAPSSGVRPIGRTGKSRSPRPPYVTRTEKTRRHESDVSISALESSEPPSNGAGATPT